MRYADGAERTVAPGAFVKPKGYAAYLRSDHWRRIRKRARARDGERCVICKGTTRLEVHHLTYERLGRERLDDVVTLCQRCHATEHLWQRFRRARSLA